MLSFSTCWNGHRHTNGEELVNEVLLLGFEWMELSHGMKITLLPGFKDAFEKGRIRVSGVHNFCPSPVEVIMDAPDAYEFTSGKPSERERALKLTLKSIDTAMEFDADYVVLHLGSVPVRRRTAKLEQMARDGQIHTRRYVKEKLKFVEEREAIATAYLERAREILRILVPYAEEKRVSLAIESRSHYEEVPSERELEALLEEFPSPFVGYWHDFGHVQRKANLALLDHTEWLSRVRHRLVGCHLHDVVWPDQDHHPPFHGSIDYERLLEMVPSDLPLVWEMNPRRRSRDIKKSLQNWRERFGNEDSK